MNNPKTSRRILTLMLSPALALPVYVQAQQAPALQLEEIVVTAQKRSESLQDTPVSVVAFSNDQLVANGIYTVMDLQANVPNVQMVPHPTSASTPRMYIRGIGNDDDQVTQDPKIAVYLDGTYLARTQGLSIDVADIQRVEVLRGPQGTLYGRNATGGAINFITAPPVTDDFNFSQQITVGERDLLRSKTNVNIPLGDTAAVKLAYLLADQNGYVKNEGTGEDYFGSKDREAYVVDFLWNVGENVDFRYTYDHSEINDSPSFLAQALAAFETGTRPSKGSPLIKNLPHNDIRTGGHTVDIEWTPRENLSLKSHTSYRDLDQFTYQNYLTGVFGPFAIFENPVDAEQQQFSQEFQLLGSSSDGKFEYILGLFYFEEDGDHLSTSIIPSSSFVTQTFATFDNTAYALYGQGTWTPDVMDNRLHVTLGGRWSKDSRAATRTRLSGVIGGPLTLAPGEGDGDKDFDNFSGSAILEYDLSDGVNVYAKVVQGYQSGGYNTRAISNDLFNAGFDEETLISYEIGAKSQWWDDRLRANLAVFRSDYDDIQVNVSVSEVNPTLTDVLNAGKATLNGFEFDLTALLYSGLSLDIRYGYVDADYKELIDGTGANVKDDYRFRQVPLHSVSTDLRYEFNSTPVGTLAATLNYTWQDEKFNSATRFQGAFLGTEDYGLLNARLTLSEIPVPTGDLEIALWGRNLEDKEYYVDHFAAGAPAAMYGEPRTYGMDLLYSF